jgi:hypothetical protein
MGSYYVAKICEQGENMILVAVDSSFQYKILSYQREIAVALHRCAAAAGLKGIVIPVWEDFFGSFCFLAPTTWHPFLRTIDMDYVLANYNDKISCFMEQDW